MCEQVDQERVWPKSYFKQLFLPDTAEAGAYREPFEWIDLNKFSAVRDGIWFTANQLVCRPGEVELTVAWMPMRGPVLGSEDMQFEPCLLTYAPGQRVVPFTMGGVPLLWDLEDQFIRSGPDPGPEVEREVFPWLYVVDQQMLRVRRDYAEAHLSQACLDYAFRATEAGYDWYMGDGSWSPLVYECFEALWPVWNRKEKRKVHPALEQGAEMEILEENVEEEKALLDFQDLGCSATLDAYELTAYLERCAGHYLKSSGLSWREMEGNLIGRELILKEREKQFYEQQTRLEESQL